MKYKLNRKALFPLEGKVYAFELAKQANTAAEIIWGFLEAGEFRLTQDGYNKLHDSWKQYYIAVEDKTPATAEEK